MTLELQIIGIKFLAQMYGFIHFLYLDHLASLLEMVYIGHQIQVLVEEKMIMLLLIIKNQRRVQTIIIIIITSKVIINQLIREVTLQWSHPILSLVKINMEMVKIKTSSFEQILAEDLLWITLALVRNLIFNLLNRW